MTRAHICNAFFELELEKRDTRSLKNLIYSHPPFAQLQFLPLLYAGREDVILVTDLPENPDSRLHLLDSPPAGITEIEDWGPSLAIANWAQEHQIPYASSDWELIRTINEKPFSFINSPKLPNAELLYTNAEVQCWIEKTPGPKVLKNGLGTAGRGHCHVSPGKNCSSFIERNLPLIGEPWVERLFDFSTQWKEGTLLGATQFENDKRGTYKGTTLKEVPTWALEEHLEFAQPLVEKIKEMGYSGHLGIDAYVYSWGGEKKIQSIVEINGRKTMSWVALQMQQPIQYTRSAAGLLPTSLKALSFSRNLTLFSSS